MKDQKQEHEGRTAKAFAALTDQPQEPELKRDGECAHCWHQWGIASGGITTTGTYSRGTNRCCHCGETKRYDYSTSWTEPPRHGRFFAVIASRQL